MAEKEKKRQILEEDTEVLVRIFGQDVKGSKKIPVGLTYLKGISWSISNIVCKKLKINKDKRISELSKDQISEIEKFIKKIDSPEFLRNRRKELETGETNHLLGVDLDMRKEFDIKRMKQIKNYKGVRHSLKLPVRGQRTRSHFRKSGIAVGVKKPKTGKKG